MSKKQKLIVEFELPGGASGEDAKEYVRNALLAEVGQLHPEDPMINFDRASLEVKFSQRNL